jgi:hypothetical protein
MYFYDHPVYSCLFTFGSAARPGPLKPSDTALVLQYDSGPSSDFLARMLGVDTPLFLFKMQFYFPLSSLGAAVAQAV